MKLCKKCGKENSDSSAYCSNCGAFIDDAAADNVQHETYEQQQAFEPAYDYQPRYAEQPPYRQGYTPPPQPPVSKGKVIAGLVLGIMFGGILGLIFGIIALVSYSDYESAVARGDFSVAAEKCEKIRKFNKLTWIFAILGLVFTILFSVIASVLVGSRILAELESDPSMYDLPFDYDYDFDLTICMIRSFIGIF